MDMFYSHNTTLKWIREELMNKSVILSQWSIERKANAYISGVLHYVNMLLFPPWAKNRFSLC